MVLEPVASVNAKNAEGIPKPGFGLILLLSPHMPKRSMACPIDTQVIAESYAAAY